MADPYLTAIGAGAIAGLIAGGVTEAYQAIAAKPFGQDKQPGEPATEQAAETVAGKLPESERKPAGRLVHYATGVLVGALYGGLTLIWPPIVTAFGLFYGVLLWLWLDLVVVPAAGWGKPVWKTGIATLAYGLTAHLVFGAVLEGARRLLTPLLA